MARPPDPIPRLILASGSPYKRKLLSRLMLPFECRSPACDELRCGTPCAVALENARRKAEAVARECPEAWIIGADQVAVLDTGEILGKPGSSARAEAQLERMSGGSVCFLTAAVLRTPSGTSSAVVPTTVHLRRLTRAEIRAYVAADRPLDSAGSFKVESLGIALFTKIETADPTALEGLPLITLAGWLEPLRRLQTGSRITKL